LCFGYRVAKRAGLFISGLAASLYWQTYFVVGKQLRTLVSILIYAGTFGVPLGTLLVLAAVIWGKITGRPPAGLLADMRPHDLICIVGMGIAMITMLLWLIGIGLAIMFVTPTLKGLVLFIGSLFGL
jgi:hypothetical protein